MQRAQTPATNLEAMPQLVDSCAGLPERSALVSPTHPGAPSRLAEAQGESLFDRIYDENVAFVWRSVRRLGVPDDAADDVVQGVFLVVHRRLGEFEAKSTIRTWLFAIAVRVVQDHKRTVRRKSPHLLGHVEPCDAACLPDVTSKTPYEAMERSEAAALVDGLLDELDDEKRVVFILAELEQMTAQEIAQATGLSPRAVYSRLRAARADFERAAARLRRRSGWGQP